MGNLEKCNYKLNVYLLSIVGLWPGKSTMLRRIQKVGCSFIVIHSLICQLTPFITMQYSAALIFHNIPTIIVAMGCILKYFTFLFHSDDVKKITDLVKHDWSTTKDDEESLIIKHHANVGTSYTTACAKFLYPMVIVCLLSLYTPWFLDLVAPLNETRRLQFFSTFDVFVDQQKYFHILVLPVSASYFTLGTVYLATESVYAMWLQHLTSQFEIYVYRIRKAFLGDSTKMHIEDRNARINKIFAGAVDMHGRAILLGMYLKKFWWSYFILLGFGVASLSIFLYRLSELLKSLDNLDELPLCVTIIVLELGYMYYVNYMVQQAIDSYENVCAAAYDTNWYSAPLRAQKMLLFVMIRNMRSISGKLFGMYDPSMEGFMVLIKMTLSYFMMIHSMH